MASSTKMIKRIDMMFFFFLGGDIFSGILRFKSESGGAVR